MITTTDGRTRTATEGGGDRARRDRGLEVEPRRDDCRMSRAN